jgi:hypothetical protein
LLPADAQTRYAAWLVDLDGTLYHPTPVKLAMAAELLLFGWGSIKTLRTFRHAHEALRHLPSDALALQQSPFERQLAHAAAELARPPSDVARTVQEWMFERPLKWVARSKRRVLLDALARYRSAGGKTALVSDYPATGKLGALGGVAARHRAGALPGHRRSRRRRRRRGARRRHGRLHHSLTLRYCLTEGAGLGAAGALGARTVTSTLS